MKHCRHSHCDGGLTRAPTCQAPPVAGEPSIKSFPITAFQARWLQARFASAGRDTTVSRKLFPNSRYIRLRGSQHWFKSPFPVEIGWTGTSRSAMVRLRIHYPACHCRAGNRIEVQQRMVQVFCARCCEETSQSSQAHWPVRSSLGHRSIR